MLVSHLIRRATLVAIAVAVVAPSRRAVADAENRSFAVERFRLGGADGVLAADSGQVLTGGQLFLSAWLSTERGSLTLIEGNNERTVTHELVARRWMTTLSATLGLGHRLELGLELPIILSQDRPPVFTSTYGKLDELQNLRLGDLRLAPKLNVIRGAEGELVLGLSPVVTLPTGGSSDYRGDGSFTISPEAEAVVHWGAARFAANLGWRMRRGDHALNLRVNDELYVSGGAALKIATSVEMSVGLVASTAAKAPLEDAAHSSAEALLGASFHTPRGIDVLFVSGLGLVNGYGTPDWRGAVAVRYQR